MGLIEAPKNSEILLIFFGISSSPKKLMLTQIKWMTVAHLCSICDKIILTNKGLDLLYIVLIKGICAA